MAESVKKVLRESVGLEEAILVVLSRLSPEYGSEATEEITRKVRHLSFRQKKVKEALIYQREGKEIDSR